MGGGGASLQKSRSLVCTGRWRTSTLVIGRIARCVVTLIVSRPRPWVNLWPQSEDRWEMLRRLSHISVNVRVRLPQAPCLLPRALLAPMP